MEVTFRSVSSAPLPWLASWLSGVTDSPGNRSTTFVHFNSLLLPPSYRTYSWEWPLSVPSVLLLLLPSSSFYWSTQSSWLKKNLRGSARPTWITGNEIDTAKRTKFISEGWWEGGINPPTGCNLTNSSGYRFYDVILLHGNCCVKCNLISFVALHCTGLFCSDNEGVFLRAMKCPWFPFDRFRKSLMTV